MDSIFQAVVIVSLLALVFFTASLLDAGLPGQTFRSLGLRAWWSIAAAVMLGAVGYFGISLRQPSHITFAETASSR
jgi:small-conductance mechanosensitive channel